MSAMSVARVTTWRMGPFLNGERLRVLGRIKHSVPLPPDVIVTSAMSTSFAFAVALPSDSKLNGDFEFEGGEGLRRLN